MSRDVAIVGDRPAETGKVANIALIRRSGVMQLVEQLEKPKVCVSVAGCRLRGEPPASAASIVTQDRSKTVVGRELLLGFALTRAAAHKSRYGVAGCAGSISRMQ